MNQTLGVHKPWKLTYHTYGKLGWMVNIWFNERMIHIIVILPQGTTTQALWYIPITSWSETIRISIYTPYFVYTCTLVLFFLFQKVFYINLGCLFHFDRCLQVPDQIPGSTIYRWPHYNQWEDGLVSYVTTFEASKLWLFILFAKP